MIETIYDAFILEDVTTYFHKKEMFLLLPFLLKKLYYFPFRVNVWSVQATSDLNSFF